MKKILIIGAGMLQTYVIQRAKELGYYTLAVDGDKNAPGFQFCDDYQCINIVHEEECLLYAREKQIDGVLTAATDYGVRTASYIAQQMGLNGLNYNSAKIIKDKYMVRKVLHQKGVKSIPQYFEVETEADVIRLSDAVGYPIIVKPCDASGSRAVAKVEDKTVLLPACLDAIENSISKKALLETYIHGNEYGVESFVYDGKIHVLAVMKKTMTPPPAYAELGHALPAGVPEVIQKRFEKAAVEIIAALGINFGSVNMDFILDNAKHPVMVDIGARMGGNLIGSHIIPLSTGIDYIGNMLRASVGESVVVRPEKNKQIATKILNLSPGIVKQLPDLDSLYEKYQCLKYAVFNITKGSEIRSYKTNLDGCGYVVCEGATLEEAERNAQKVRDDIDEKLIREFTC